MMCSYATEWYKDTTAAGCTTINSLSRLYQTAACTMQRSGVSLSCLKVMFVLQ